MTKFLTTAAIIAHIVAFLASLAAVWVVYSIFKSMTQGGQPEFISMLFAIGIAVIPYCLAGTLHRLVEIQNRNDIDARSG